MRQSSKSPKAIAKKKAWEAFSRYIRARDCYLTTNTLDKGACITCGKIFDFKDLQAGHAIGGRGNSILFDEDATHAQCKQCNVMKHGDYLTYRDRMVEMYGEKHFEWLRVKAKIAKQYKAFEFDALAHYYQERYEELCSQRLSAWVPVPRVPLA